MWSFVLSRLLLSVYLCSCPWLVWKSLKLHNSDLHPTSVTVCPCHMPQYQLLGPSTVPVSHSKLSRKVGSWPASGMASFELFLFKVSWPKAIGWHEDSDKGCARGRKTDWLWKLEQNPSFVTCLSGPLQLRGMWIAEATDSRFSKPSECQNLMLILALHQLQLLHPISSLKVFQPSRTASHMTSSRNQLVTQQGCGWTLRCSFELGWLIQKWFWEDSVLCPFVKLKKNLFILLHQVLGAACGIFSCGMWTLSYGMWDLVPWPGIEHRPPALAVWNLSHWTTRESQCVLSRTVISGRSSSKYRYKKRLHSLAGTCVLQPFPRESLFWIWKY